MEQVQPVADPAQADEHADLQQPPHRSVHVRGGDDDGGQEGEQGQATVVRPSVSGRGEDDGRGDGGERSEPDPSQPVGQRPAEAQGGQQRASEELGGTGGGGEVGHVRTPATGDERCSRGSDHEERGQHPDDRPAGALRHHAEHQHGGRPQHVELLLDGQ